MTSKKATLHQTHGRSAQLARNEDMSGILTTCRFERVTGKPAHPLLRRGVFYTHRDLTEILDCYEKGQPFYLYTGRVGYLLSLNSIFFLTVRREQGGGRGKVFDFLMVVGI